MDRGGWGWVGVSGGRGNGGNKIVRVQAGQPLSRNGHASRAHLRTATKAHGLSISLAPLPGHVSSLRGTLSLATIRHPDGPPPWPRFVTQTDLEQHVFAHRNACFSVLLARPLPPGPAQGEFLQQVRRRAQEVLRGIWGSTSCYVGRLIFSICLPSLCWRLYPPAVR